MNETITVKEFETQYIEHYKLLENDFKAVFSYITPDEENDNVYSIMFLKQLLSIGSEIDVLRKALAKIYFLCFNEKKDNAFLKIAERFPDLRKLEVKFKPNDRMLKPWDYPKEPDWWTVYNELKHNRLTYCNKETMICGNAENKKWYQYANQKNVLLALAALHSLELISFKEISVINNAELPVPKIKSIFKITNSFWKDIQYGDGDIFYNGNLYAF